MDIRRFRALLRSFTKTLSIFWCALPVYTYHQCTPLVNTHHQSIPPHSRCTRTTSAYHLTNASPHQPTTTTPTHASSHQHTTSAHHHITFAEAPPHQCAGTICANHHRCSPPHYLCTRTTSANAPPPHTTTSHVRTHQKWTPPQHQCTRTTRSHNHQSTHFHHKGTQPHQHGILTARAHHQ